MSAAKQPTESRREQIASAALAVISEEGLGRFTTAAIAARVGVTEGALFRHFGSKEEIVLAAMDRVEEILFAGFPPHDDDPIARLGKFFAQRVAVVRQHPVVARIVHSDALEHAAGAAGAARVAEWKSRTVGLVSRCLEEASAAGLLRPGLPVAHLRVLVLGAFMATALGGHVGAQTDVSAVWSTLERLLRVPDQDADKSRRPRRKP